MHFQPVCALQTLVIKSKFSLAQTLGLEWWSLISNICHSHMEVESLGRGDKACSLMTRFSVLPSSGMQILIF